MQGMGPQDIVNHFSSNTVKNHFLKKKQFFERTNKFVFLMVPYDHGATSGPYGLLDPSGPWALEPIVAAGIGGMA